MGQWTFEIPAAVPARLEAEAFAYQEILGAASRIERGQVRPRAFALTHPPRLYHYGDEVFNVIEALCSGEFGVWAEVAAEWLDHDRRTVRGPEALGANLWSHGMMLCRSRADVGRDLPTLHLIANPIEAHPAVYDDARDEVAKQAQIILGQTGATRAE